MKRSYALFLVAAMVMATAGLWIFVSLDTFKSTDFIHFVVIILLVGFALFIGVKRLTSERRGEPVEDELSKRVLQKTAAISYYISLYIWVFMIFLKDRTALETEELLGTGILAMAVTFAVTWVIINFRGLRNE